MNFLGRYDIRFQPSVLSTDNLKQLTSRFRHGHAGSAPVRRPELERSAWQCVRLFAIDRFNKSALVTASRERRVDDVRALLQDPRIDPNHVDPKTGMTALAMATANGDTDIIKVLLQDERTDLNHVDPTTGMTALAVAAAMGETDVIKVLLEDERTDPNRQIVQGTNAVRRDQGMTESLTKAQPGMTPLAIAAMKGDEQSVRALLEHRKDNIVWLDIADATGHTPLSHAATQGRVAVLRVLAQEQLINVDQCPEGEPILVHVVRAAKRFDSEAELAEAIEYLRMAGAKVDQSNADNQTALDIAIANNDVAAVRALCVPMEDLLARHEGVRSRVQYGSVVNLHRANGTQTPISAALARGTEMLDALFEHPDIQESYVDELVRAAIARGEVDMARRLLDCETLERGQETREERLTRHFKSLLDEDPASPEVVECLLAECHDAIAEERWADAFEFTRLLPPVPAAQAWQGFLQEVADKNVELLFEEFDDLLNAVEKAAREGSHENDPRVCIDLSYESDGVKVFTTHFIGLPDERRAWFRELGVWPGKTTRDEIDHNYQKRVEEARLDPHRVEVLTDAYARAQIVRRDLYPLDDKASKGVLINPVDLQSA
ncbi:MAG TPA: ankyrin repeat domain-containing protein [Albitalea sp.]